MKKRNANKWLCGTLLTGALGMTSALAADAAPGIVGKNDWLFYRYELSEAPDAAMTAESIALIQRFNKVLAANGVSMAVTMVPLKMRIYAEHLPDSIKLNDYVSGNYERMTKALQAAGNAGSQMAEGLSHKYSNVSQAKQFLGIVKAVGESSISHRG